MSISYLVLTNCTARKRAGGKSLRLTARMLGSDLSETAARWKTALASHEPRMQAQQLYVGRSMADAKHVAADLNAPLYVVSAGLGMVAGEDLVAPYDLTTAPKKSGLDSALSRYGGTAAEWWASLCAGHGLARLLRENPRAILLAALPANYVAMVSADLALCAPSTLQRLRIFTSRAGAKGLAEPLASTVMPYDERLESVPHYAGTRADFPQRALRHFVERVDGHKLNRSAGQAAVESALAEYRPPQTFIRTRAHDEEIKELIRRQWRAGERRSSVLLRYLRDEALIACEQGRFAQLWREVRDEFQGKAA